MKRKKNILKEAGVFLVVVLMTLSAVAVTANISKKGLKTESNALPSPSRRAPIALFSYDFNDWHPQLPFPPAGWTVYDQDTNPRTWEFWQIGTYWGNGCAKCWYDGLPNDDWLITPKSSAAVGDKFSFMVKGGSSLPGFKDNFEVYSSTTGPTVNDFLTGTLLETDTATNSYTPCSCTISTSTPEIWFAIHYKGTPGQPAVSLCVDNVTFPDDSTEGFELASYWNSWVSMPVLYEWEGNGTVESPHADPHSLPYLAEFKSSLIPSLGFARLSTKDPINLRRCCYPHRNISFWMYHDDVSSGSKDNVTVQIKISSPLLSQYFGNLPWITIGTVFRYEGGYIGWKVHNVTLPYIYRFFKVYIGFLATSNHGNNMYIDDAAVWAFR